MEPVFVGNDSVFAKRLRGLMDKNKTTQKRLADIVGTTRQAISQYMDGSVQPNIEKLYKIASFFGCSGDYLLGLDKHQNPEEMTSLIAQYDVVTEALSSMDVRGQSAMLTIIENMLEAYCHVEKILDAEVLRKYTRCLYRIIENVNALCLDYVRLDDFLDTDLYVQTIGDDGEVLNFDVNKAVLIAGETHDIHIQHLRDAEKELAQLFGLFEIESMEKILWGIKTFGGTEMTHNQLEHLYREIKIQRRNEVIGATMSGGKSQEKPDGETHAS